MTNPILNVQNLQTHFPLKQAGLWPRSPQLVRAVDDVSFTLNQGEILGLVGESGCGKSTLVLTLLGLEPVTSGQVFFNGQVVAYHSASELRALRRRMQLIFQDPFESLNPLMTVAELVTEPLLVHGLVKNKADRRQRAAQALTAAGLNPAEAFLDRRPHELSGGQRQRVVIAGALVLEPDLLLADEPVSMLDVSIRAEILNLLSDIRTERGAAIIYITHDVSTAAYIADRIAVMYLGRLVEIGPTHQILTDPQHPYTQSLLSVAPVPNPRQRRRRVILQGDPPNPIDLPAGCRFHPRCPRVFEACRTIDPNLIQLDDQRQVACLLVR